MPPAAPGADAGSVCGFHACAGNGPLTDPACWPDMGTPCAGPSWVGYPTPGGTPGRPSSDVSGWAPPLAASVPSIWAWGVSSLDPPREASARPPWPLEYFLTPGDPQPHTPPFLQL